MSRFPSLPEQPHLMDVFRRFPRGVQPLLQFHDEVLRGASELSGLGDKWVPLLTYIRKLTEGCGVVPTDVGSAASRERHELSKDSETPYQDFGKMLALSE